ncbi:hypothetical protein Hanom_Chr00s000002g01599951 [Helianthus anomalus]
MEKEQAITKLKKTETKQQNQLNRDGESGIFIKFLKKYSFFRGFFNIITQKINKTL